MNTSLSILYLGDNKITQLTSLKTCGNSSSLRYLDVKNNLIDNIPNELVDPWYLLSHLDISGNLITDIEFLYFLPVLHKVLFDSNPFAPTERLLVKARMLESLSLNRLDLEICPLISATRSSLVSIALGWNDISCIDLIHFLNWTRLKNLHLSYNNIRNFPSIGCSSDNSSAYAMRDWRFPRLQNFFMQANRLTEFPLLPDAGSLSSKFDIEVNFNQITHVSIERLTLLRNATNINLELIGNRITDMPYLSAMGQALVHAHLSNNEISYLYKEHLIGLFNLETLCLSGNRIKSFDFSALIILPSISLICFEDNIFSPVSNMTQDLTNSSLTITLENNPIVRDKQLCLLFPEAISIFQFTRAAPEKYAGHNFAVYYILKCGEYTNK